jgi:hypothetical protein
MYLIPVAQRIVSNSLLSCRLQVRVLSGMPITFTIGEFMFTPIKKLFVPRGYYCYKHLRVERDEKFGFRIKVKPCPFYMKNGNDPLYGWCKLLSLEIVDQLKECSVHLYTDRELEKMRLNHHSSS